MLKTFGASQVERWVLGAVAAAISLSVTACGAQRHGAAEPEAAPTPAGASEAMPSSQPRDDAAGEEFQDIAQATEAFDSARRELDELTVASNDAQAAPSSDAMGRAAAPSDAPSARSGAAPKASAPRVASEEALNQSEKKEDSEQTRCARICRALGSMERAANGICRILGATSERCQSAHEELNRGQTRAATCACSHP